VPKAPFVRFPIPQSFLRRAARLKSAGRERKYGALSRIPSAICDAQSAILAFLAGPRLPSSGDRGACAQFDMPPSIAPRSSPMRSCTRPAAASSTSLRRQRNQGAAKTAGAHAAARRSVARSIDRSRARRFKSGGRARRAHLCGGCGAGSLCKACVADEWRRPRSSRVGICPVCGGRPVASLIVGWYGAEGARYASCMLCATLWNEVRVKCLVCGSTKGIGYQEIDGEGGNVKAETCDECGSYVKVFLPAQRRPARAGGRRCGKPWSRPAAARERL